MAARNRTGKPGGLDTGTWGTGERRHQMQGPLKRYSEGYTKTSREAKGREMEEREEKERKWEEVRRQEKSQTSHKLSEQCHQREPKCSHQTSLWKGFEPIASGSPAMMEYCNSLFNHLKI